MNRISYGQPADAVYAGSQTNGGVVPTALGLSTGSFSVTNPDNSKSTNGVKPNNAGTHLSVASVAGVAAAWVQLAFAAQSATAIDANTTVYIKTTSSVLGLLGLVGGAGLTVQAYSDASGIGNPVTSSTPQSYYTADGGLYIAITPSANFRSIRINLASGGLLGSGDVDIYFAFFGKTANNTSNPFPYSVADCGLPNVSTIEYIGAGFTIASPSNAIDGSTVTASAFNTTGLLSIGTMSQTFYFNGTSNSSDAVKLLFSRGSGTTLVSVNLGSGISIQAYNGDTPVGSSSLFSALVDADLLGLLNTGTTLVTAYFAPKNGTIPVIFDRVKVSFSLGLGISVNGNGLNIYDIRRVPDVPIAPDVTACTNIGKINLAALTPQESITNIGNFTYTWYNTIRDGSILTNLIGKTPLVNGLTSVGQSYYYVDITKSGCSIPSGRKEVMVTVVNPPVIPAVALKP